MHKTEIISCDVCLTFGTRRQTRRVGSWPGALQGVPAGLSDARWGADTQSEQTNDHGGGDDDGVGGHRAAGDTDRIERVYLDGNHAYRSTHDYNGPYWRAEWWAQVPVSKRGAQLRDTRDGERPNDVDSADNGGAGDALPELR
jgi:hypothetical protein